MASQSSKRRRAGAGPDAGTVLISLPEGSGGEGEQRREQFGGGVRRASETEEGGARV